MDKKYQSISKYDGTLSGKLNSYRESLYGEPRYEGIEYDWEVPDNLVVGSPGGVSTIHHHYTKGFNGRGNTSSDIYAGQGERYNSGIYGNLYQTGHEAGQHMGYYSRAPDYQFWQNDEPSQYAYSNSVSSTWAPSMKIYKEPGSYETSPNDKKKVENYDYYTEGGIYYEGEGIEDDFELVQQADDADNQQTVNIVDVQQNIRTVTTNSFKPWVLFLFFIMAFIAFDFWAESGHLFISQYFHNGGTPSWKRSVLYSIIVTLLFVFIIWISGVPITDFENL